jgi:hypothetical protein
MDMFAFFEGAPVPGFKPHPHNADCGCEPIPTTRKRARRTLEARLWAKVDKSAGPNACWLWTGKADSGNGYGRIINDGVKTQAHRAAYIVTHGSVPVGKNVLHSRACTSRLCCNPAHLRAGSAAENTADAKALNRLSRRLKPAEVCEIVAACRDEGLNYRVASERFKITPQTVANIMSGRTWSKLTGIGKRNTRKVNSRGKLELRAVA